MSTTIRVKGVYSHLDCLLTGIERLKKAGFRGYDVVAPLPRHEIEEAVYEGRPSPVRWWTLTGGMTGITGGLLIASLTHAQWPMINPGGKPVVSLPPFAVIMFESTIMCAGLATFAGLIVHCGLPSFWLDEGIADPRVSDASFSIVFTRAAAADSDRIQEILRGSGAIEVSTGTDAIYNVPNPLEVTGA